MQVARTIAEMRGLCKDVRRVAAAIGLVPTMGALHEGHLSLVRAAKASCDFVTASIFVNPLQFGRGEDFLRYPRTFAADCELLEAEGVDVVFAPAAREMVAPSAQTVVDVGPLAGRLDGASRPGHFQGVATIVAKLFHTVRPDRAFFGQKDAAQVAVLRAMVRDLNFDVEIVVCPTVRAEDGLALSSRNRYLKTEEREQALALSRTLHNVEQQIAREHCAADDLREVLVNALRSAPGLRLEYAEIVDAQTLEPVSDIANGALIAVAAWVGGTRLIDNVVVAPGGLEGDGGTCSAPCGPLEVETAL